MKNHAISFSTRAQHTISCRLTDYSWLWLPEFLWKGSSQCVEDTRTTGWLRDGLGVECWGGTNCDASILSNSMAVSDAL
ncbi:hypothetical protein LSTR_LSTR011036 [Laodelphax striatellus]|uniref:Uncharacterized protein n=1 Tax=Laodelphax striatellus TaxID=195883 RepID=A0A482WGC8_LAOST|nr:hypothetical protein LSTR_LSTR011036 [Laodelphax striatellus]